MATLAANKPRSYELGDINAIPMIAADIIYEGAAVGIVAASGHAQPLVSPNKFAGFAEDKADNSAGAAAAINVRVKNRGMIQLAVANAVITDIGKAVYATDDDTFVLTAASGVYVGVIRKFVSAGVVVVEYDVSKPLAAAAGSALAAYATGAFGVNSDANMSALHALVVNMRAALIANGMMSS